MKQRATIVGLCIILAVITIAPWAHADVLLTEPTTIPNQAPLMITSFQTLDGAKDLAFVELYNSGNTPISLRDWAITDPANNRSLVVEDRDGYIEPNTHVVVARDDAVAGATYTITGWSSEPALLQPMTDIELVNPQYRPHDTAIATKSIDKWMMRSYLTAGYSSTTFETAYRALFDDGVYAVPDAPEGLQIIEIYPYASSCDPFDTSVLCGDYVKLYNASPVVIDLSSYVLRTDSSSVSRTNANAISLVGELQPGEYTTVTTTDNGTRLSLTNSGGYVWVEDAWGLARYTTTLAHYESAGSALQGYAYAVNADDDFWQWTSTPMPFSANVITPVAASCPDGKYLNPETNRCRTLEDTLNALSACEEGYERNPTTNRCRKIASASTSTLTPCKEGQVRNPETNRCKAAASEASTLTPCNEGYERNPATNRCRKTAVDGASTTKYPVEPYAEGDSSSATWWAIGGVAAIALGYAVWEWRQELAMLGVRIRTGLLRR